MHLPQSDARLAFPLVEGLALLGRPDKSAAYRLVRDGRLATFRIGRRRMVSRRALEECLVKLEREEKERVSASAGTPVEPVAA